MVRRHPIDSGEDTFPGAGAIAVEHPNGYEPHVLRDAVRRASDRTGDVRAVAVAILRAPTIADFVDAARSPSAEFAMRAANAGVDDVGVYTVASCVVDIARVEWQVMLVDAIKTPCCAGLVGDGTHHRVLFDANHRRILRQS